MADLFGLRCGCRLVITADSPAKMAVGAFMVGAGLFRIAREYVLRFEVPGHGREQPPET